MAGCNQAGRPEKPTSCRLFVGYNGRGVRRGLIYAIAEFRWTVRLVEG